MDTVSWPSTVHLSITTIQLLQSVTAGYMNSVWINREDVKDQPSVSCLFPPAKQKHQCSLHEALTSGDTGLHPITFSWCRNNTLACTEKKHTDAKNLHIILHLWESWWQSSHGLRMVWSQNSWWVWYEPLGKEEGWGGWVGGGIPDFQPGWSAKACSSPVPQRQCSLQPAGCPVSGTSC